MARYAVFGLANHAYLLGGSEHLDDALPEHELIVGYDNPDSGPISGGAHIHGVSPLPRQIGSSS